MAVSKSANITALASDYVIISWTCSLPVESVSFRFAGESDWIRVFNGSGSEGYLDVYQDAFRINDLESNTDYTVEVKILERNATNPDYDTPDVVLNFTTVEEANMAASIDAVMVNANTLRILWNTNMSVADAYYKINGEAPGIGIEFPSGATSGTVYITDIAVGDFIEFYFVGEALGQNIVITYYITETNVLPTPDNNPVPDIDVDLNKLVFPYIYEDFTKKPKDVLTSRDWNAAISLLIHQGNYTAKALNMLDIANINTGGTGGNTPDEDTPNEDTPDESIPEGDYLRAQDILIETGTISNGGYIPKNEAYEQTIFFVSLQTFGIDALYNIEDNAFMIGTQCSVNQETGKVTAKRLYYIGDPANYDPENPREADELANYVAIHIGAREVVDLT